MATPLTNDVEETHWVHGPAPSPAMKSIPVPGIQQNFPPLDVIWVLPGSINKQRLLTAFSEWLKIVPHFAGRLSYFAEDSSWTIMLSEAYGIPITFTRYDGSYTEREMFDGVPALLDPMPWMQPPREAFVEEPLIRFKVSDLTQYNETCIALHASHCLCDGVAVIRSMNMLSQLYCGAKVSDLPPVTFEGYYESPPSYRHLSAKALEVANKKTPHFTELEGFAPEDFVMKWLQSMENTERVDLFFTKQEMDVLTRRANATLPAHLPRLGTYDILPAFIMSVMNRVYGIPKFNRLVNVLEFRGRPVRSSSSFKMPPKTSTGNAVIVPTTDPVPSDGLTDMTAIATLIRENYLALKDPDLLVNVVSVTTHRLLELSKNGEVVFFVPEDGDGFIGCNLLHNFSIRVPFGFDRNRCRVYCIPAQKHSMRSFEANPIRRPDGTWDSREGVIHVFYLVVDGYGQKVQDMIKEELARWVEEDRVGQYAHAVLAKL